MLRGMYKQMIGAGDDWSLMVGATVPVAPWSRKKYLADQARAEANAQTARSDLIAMNNEIASEVYDAFLNVESSVQRLTFAKTTALPQARQTLESALAAYRTGTEEFLMIIDIERMLISVKLDYHSAVAALLDGRSRLERAVGTNPDETGRNDERGIR
jgi:outer membrane protein TolC